MPSRATTGTTTTTSSRSSAAGRGRSSAPASACVPTAPRRSTSTRVPALPDRGARRACRVEPVHRLEQGHVLRDQRPLPCPAVRPAGDRHRVRQQHDLLRINIAAIVLADEYADVPSSRRPLVQNNILGQQKNSLLTVARTATNVIFSGQTCPGDRHGDPHLVCGGLLMAESSPLGSLSGGTGERGSGDGHHGP